MHRLVPPRLPVSRYPRRAARGFTLLEVMLATAILAVGSVSVIMVFATATGFAHRRQAGQQLAQVLDEARSEARAYVNDFVPPSSLRSAAAKKGRSKEAKPQADLPGGPGGVAPKKSSSIFTGYAYELRFEPVRRDALEAGFRTRIEVMWGETAASTDRSRLDPVIRDAQTYVETLVIAQDQIDRDEFVYSTTYEEERAGAPEKGAREVR